MGIADVFLVISPIVNWQTVWLLLFRFLFI
jgi:hypothetical protein